jgi:hypothetical protein
MTAKLDAFTNAYLECAVWVDCNSDSEDLSDKDFDDLADETIASAIEDCTDFQSSFAGLLEMAYGVNGYSIEKAGHDFWLTRNHHGAGFWDRGLPRSIGKRLTEMAHAYGSLSLYLGDDGKVYTS